tara:strand:- start:178 stop:663 length:486 start_codon:yes stop_codon:yes gene_type:complete
MILLNDNIKMKQLNLNIYLSGEIHSEWRENIKKLSINKNLSVSFFEPVTNHSSSDDCGVKILGSEENRFWHDYKGASMNSMRIKTLIEKSDIVIIRFGAKYKQWNAAFDAGMAVSYGKSIITFHDKELDHALKEIDSSACAVCRTEEQIVQTLQYILHGTL